MRITSLLTWILSSNSDLAMPCLHQCASDEAHELGFFALASVAALIMLDWLREDQTYHPVLAAINSDENPYRQSADTFLRDSTVAEFIGRRSAKVITVDLAQTILVWL